MVPGFFAYDNFDDTIIYRFKILFVFGNVRKIEVKSPSVGKCKMMQLLLHIQELHSKFWLAPD